MEVTKPIVGLVVAACVAVGAAGSYLTTRHSTPATDPAEYTENAGPGASGDDLSVPVEQSETVVNEAKSAQSPAGPAASARAAAPHNAPAHQTPAPATHPQPASTPAPSSSPALTDITPIAPAPIEPVRPPEPEVAKVVEPPVPEYQDLVLAPDSVIGLKVQKSISSETAKVEDPVVATVTRDVKVGDHIAIPAGAEAHGEVTLVERGGKLKDRARLGVRFTSIVLADGMRVPITTETIYRDGDEKGRASTTKIGGGAIGGAIIGGIFGGAKGAAIGSAIGGGAGSAAVMAGDRSAATLPQGSAVTVRLQQPSTVTIQR
jgi:hypothetical protein